MNILKRPVVLIHGLWNSSDIFSSISKKLDEYEVEYFAPTLSHDFGMISIVDLTSALNEIILNRYGLDREIDIVGFSMGGIIGRYWIKKFNGYKRTNKFISIGSPHTGTLTAQLVPRFPFKGISEMKRNSNLLRELSKDDDLLQEIKCISFYTKWDIMVFPGWKAHLPRGAKLSLEIYKHKNLIRNSLAVNKIVKEIIN